MAVDKSLISGSTTLLILSLLEEKDMYGYEMIDTLKGKSNNVQMQKKKFNYIRLKKGWLTVYEQEAGGKMRKYYQLTKEGKKQYKVKKEEWKEYSEAILQVIGGVCFGTT